MLKVSHYQGRASKPRIPDRFRRPRHAITDILILFEAFHAANGLLVRYARNDGPLRTTSGGQPTIPHQQPDEYVPTDYYITATIFYIRGLATAKKSQGSYKANRC